jgi:DNA-directed RNA polymerase specialized sigma24 family protein
VFPRFDYGVQAADMTSPDSDPAGSVTRLLSGLSSADPTSVTAVFNVYFSRLSSTARQLLDPRHLRTVDGEDVALSVLNLFFADAAAGNLPGINSRHDVWKLLNTRLRNRAFNYRRDLDAQKRGGRGVIPETDLTHRNPENCAGLDAFPDSATIALDVLQSLHTELLESLSDPVRKLIATRLLEGHSVPEISEELELSIPTIHRKIQLIRSRWEELSAR